MRERKLPLIKRMTKRRVHYVVAFMLLSLMLSLSSCNVAGFILQGPFGGPSKHEVDARYLGLNDQEIAVMVSADASLLYHYPEARTKLCKALSGQLAMQIPGAKLVRPDDVMAFTNRHQAWTTMPFGQLLKKLEVGRIVHVDLIEYRTNEPGDSNVQRGQITAKIGVVEAQSKTPDDYVYLETVSARYPNDTVVGVVNSDLSAIEAGMVDAFTVATVNLFQQHTVMKK